jgi:hypothetical protein
MIQDSILQDRSNNSVTVLTKEGNRRGKNGKNLEYVLEVT